MLQANAKRREDFAVSSKADELDAQPGHPKEYGSCGRTRLDDGKTGDVNSIWI